MDFAYRGQTITYDEIGNPLSYYNGYPYSFTWENGRRLATATRGATSLSFEYNDEGIRTSKVVNGVEHIYYLNGSQIIAELWGNSMCIYLYDNDGSPIGMQYRTTSYAAGDFDTFWFTKNVHGDIVSVYNDNGTKLLTYHYDAWGNFTTQWHLYNGSDYYASYNPFKYRGYYHDSETGFYYLNSRYYDPATGRFINADGLVSTGQGLVGYNMYAYCNNNPVNTIASNNQLPYLGGHNTSVNNVVVDKLMSYYKKPKEDNSDEIRVLKAKAWTYTYYNGKLVIKLPIGKEAFSFGAMFIGDGVTDVNVVKHEYGHTVQFDSMGAWDYLINVGVPSLTGFIMYKKNKLPYSYFTSPWEAQADEYGKVPSRDRDTSNPWTDSIGYYGLKDLFDALF